MNMAGGGGAGGAGGNSHVKFGCLCGSEGRGLLQLGRPKACHAHVQSREQRRRSHTYLLAQQIQLAFGIGHLLQAGQGGGCVQAGWEMSASAKAGIGVVTPAGRTHANLLTFSLTTFTIFQNSEMVLDVRAMLSTMPQLLIPTSASANVNKMALYTKAAWSRRSCMGCMGASAGQYDAFSICIAWQQAHQRWDARYTDCWAGQ